MFDRGTRRWRRHRVVERVRRAQISAASLLALALAGCAPEPEPGSEAEEGTRPAASADTLAGAGLAAPAGGATPGWADRAWVRADPTDMPGQMRIFLSDGTLVMDSCWEVYRLARWRQAGGDTLAWSEDGQEIRAVLMEQGEASLRLRLLLVDGTRDESYRPADVPYVCPEMAR